jgi:transposase
MVFTGGCDRDVFNIWLKQILIPELKPGTTIVMDNASFHKSDETKKIIEDFGCFLKFLPTYSPSLNLIERLWHELKSVLRPIIQVRIADMIKTVSNGLIIMQNRRQY